MSSGKLKPGDLLVNGDRSDHLGRSRMIHTTWILPHLLPEWITVFFCFVYIADSSRPQRSRDRPDAITRALNGNAPDQSNTSTSGRTEICCWNMIFSLFAEISSPHSEMKINGCICHPRPIYQLVDVAAGWIDFFFFFRDRRESTAAHICKKQPQICCIRGQRHYLILSYLLVKKSLKVNLDLQLHHFGAQSVFLTPEPAAHERFSCNTDKELKILAAA